MLELSSQQNLANKTVRIYFVRVFKDMPTSVGNFLSSPSQREKRDSKGDERGTWKKEEQK